VTEAAALRNETLAR